MNYKLKNTNGKVTFLLRTGKDLVKKKKKNQMAIASAQHIIDNGKLLKSDVDGYPINIDNRWYFEGELSKRTVSNKSDVKAEDKE